MVDPDLQPLVLDHGSGTCRAGFGGEDAPRSIFPTVVGRPRNPSIMIGMDARDCYVGEEALARAKDLKLKYPIERGMVTNWNDMEKIWHHTFYNGLRVTPEEHPVVVTQAAGTPINNNEKMQSIMFETFNVVAMYSLCTASSSVYCRGLIHGMVVSSGYGVSHACAVHRHHLSDGTVAVKLAGVDIDSRLDGLITDRPASLGMEDIRQIKEQFGFIAENYQEELAKYQQSGQGDEYELPDGTKMMIGSERFRAPEILFQPSLIDSLEPSLPEAVVKAIDELDEAPRPGVKNLMYENIILTGGSTMYPGFAQRLAKELKKLAPEKTRIKVTAPPERKFSDWIGGSILSSLSSFQNAWITKDEYDDGGATIMHRKCF